MRLAILLPALALPSLAWAVDPPVIAPGECLYLTGAPPGFPAAATEVTGSETYVYDNCHIGLQAAVGRDSTNEIELWGDPSVGTSRGCVGRAFAEHELSYSGAGPAWLTVLASGHVSGEISGVGGTVVGPASAAVWLQIVRMSPEGPIVMATQQVFEFADTGQNRRTIFDEGWSGSVMVLAPTEGLYRARVVAQVAANSTIDALDFGSPGTDRGVRYDTLEACVVPVATSGASTNGSEWERDLHEKRCLPYIWLPVANGGQLEEVMAHVLRRIDDADASDDPHANLALARDRLARAASESARGEYQRSCRSLSDGLRALTTP